MPFPVPPPPPCPPPPRYRGAGPGEVVFIRHGWEVGDPTRPAHVLKTSDEIIEEVSDAAERYYAPIRREKIEDKVFRVCGAALRWLTLIALSGALALLLGK